MFYILNKYINIQNEYINISQVYKYINIWMEWSMSIFKESIFVRFGTRYACDQSISKIDQLIFLSLSAWFTIKRVLTTSSLPIPSSLKQRITMSCKSTSLISNVLISKERLGTNRWHVKEFKSLSNHYTTYLKALVWVLVLLEKHSHKMQN